MINHMNYHVFVYNGDTCTLLIGFSILNRKDFLGVFNSIKKSLIFKPLSFHYHINPYLDWTWYWA